MKKRLIYLITFIILSVFPIRTVLAAEQPYINLGSATLELGMSKKEVIEYLDRQYIQIYTTSPEDKERGNNSFWVVLKNHPQDKLGQIIFKADKLVFISKYWGSFDDKNAFTFAKSFFSALRNTMNNDKGIALIITSIYAQPRYESKNINLRIGPYELYINFVEDSETYNTVTIIQELHDYQNYP